jgi:Subtilase family
MPVTDAPAAAAKSGAPSVLDAGLLALYQNASATAAPSMGAASLAVASSAVAHAPNAISADGKYVTIDAIAADGNGAALLSELQAIGLQHGASFRGIASGLLPVDQVGALLGVSDLIHASESGMITHAGLVTSQGDVSMHADTGRSTFGVDGTGIKVGVLSDSFATVASPITTMADDIANDDLPANTTILQDFANGTDETDEGRAMAQIIHDTAPGASIAFATANFGQANFANNIIALRNAGAQVIVDDVQYFFEPMFQDGVIAQAVNQVVASGAVYFSSAGNEGHAGYESPFIDGGSGTLGGLTETFHNFGTTVSGVPSTLLQINQVADTTYIFQWANAAASASPGVGAITDLDFAGYSDPAATNELFHFTVNEVGGDPINDLTLTGARTFYLRVGLASGPAPAALKIVAQDDRVTYGANSTNINDGTVYGHNSATGAIAVAAADYRRTPEFGVSPPLVESFSSAGPTNIWVDGAGHILSSPEVRVTPAITAPDGVNTSFFGKDTTGPNGDADSFPNFFGTSAAAPAAAATAALLLQERPGLSLPYLRSLLMNSAIDMDNGIGTSPFDFGTGAGLIQADKALDPILPPPPSGTSADMTLRHGADGLYEIYDIGNNAILAGHLLGQVGTEWAFVTLGGFSGSDTGDMLLRNATTGGFEVYDISNNNITGAAFLGTVGLDWQVAGFGNFSNFGETDMTLRNATTGGFEVYDISNNQIISANFMGAVGLDWQVGGFGNFSSRGTSDMILRNTLTGGLQVYDIDSNQITGAAFMGTVGLEWQIAGVGNFSSMPGESDIIMRNSITGAFEVYNIANNQITGAAFLGTVGLDWQVAGIAPVHAPGASDLVLRNANTGAFEVYDIANNQITGATPLGSVGLDWQLGGFAADPSTGDSSQLVQAIAGFGGSAAESSNTVALAPETSQQPLLTTPQHA